MEDRRINKAVSCLVRFEDLKPGILSEIKAHLVNSKIIKENDIDANSNSDLAAQLFLLMNKLMRDDKIQLCDYKWTILPVEVIEISILTEFDMKVFSNHD